MASFLTETLSWTGALMRHFDTFSEFRNVVIFKEPLQQVYDSGVSVMAGYDSEIGGDQGYTLIPISGVFPCVVINKSPRERGMNEFRFEVDLNQLKIKVKDDAYNFINSGKNLYFEVDGVAYNEISNVEVQNFLGLKFYIYSLKETT